jgi:hypothetical protein
MKLGDGVIQASSTKQIVNSRSTTEAELISMDNILSRVLWTKLFMEAQGCKIIENVVVLRDNACARKLQNNGKSCPGKKRDTMR